MQKRIFCLILSWFSLFAAIPAAAEDSAKISRISISLGAGVSPGFQCELSTFPASINAPSSEGSIQPTEANQHYMARANVICPDINFMADYRISSSLSLGIAASYQSENVSQSTGYGGFQIGTDFITRFDISGRLIGYAIKNTKNLFDFYYGFRFGVNFLSDAFTQYIYPNSRPISPEPFLSQPSEVEPTGQIFIGIHIAILKHILYWNLEGGLGTCPYVVETGITFNFGKKISVPLSGDKRGELNK